MTIHPCPNCSQGRARPLHGISHDAYVFYFRCQRCGHVWHVPKDHPDAEPTDVTPRTRAARHI
jgi:uncharacterized Zn finger protein